MEEGRAVEEHLDPHRLERERGEGGEEEDEGTEEKKSRMFQPQPLALHLLVCRCVCKPVGNQQRLRATVPKKN